MSVWVMPPNLHSEVEVGPPCFFSDHSLGSKSGLIPRYTDSYACVRCISSLSEGRLSLDVHRIHKPHRRKFLEFWSLAEIGEPEECWNWHGPTFGRWQTHQFCIKRHYSFTKRFPPSRVAAWFTWGDIGRLPIRNMCKNPICCNPLHIRVRGVPHFYNSRKIDFIDLEFNSQKLHHDTSLFLETLREKDPRGWKQLESQNLLWFQYRMESDGPLSSSDIRSLRTPEDYVPCDEEPEEEEEDRDERDEPYDEFDDPLL